MPRTDLFRLSNSCLRLWQAYRPQPAADRLQSILYALDSDPNATAEERRLVQECLEWARTLPTPVEQNPIAYSLCTHCGFMVSPANHTHCGNCNNPTGTINPQQSCGACRSCCQNNHYNCSSCGNHTTAGPPCRSCGYCPRCCQCERCIVCNTNTLSCLNCGSCTRGGESGRGCCHCEGREYGLPWAAGSIKERRNFNCTRLVGVEWEYNRTQTHRPLAEWVAKWHGGIHRDGSCGREVVTPPIAGDYIGQCLTDLESAFRKAGAQADRACGIHVHVAALDLAWADMFRLLKLYSKVEPLLYIIGGQHRLRNEYCYPIGEEYAEALESADPKGKVLSVAFKKADGRAYQRRNPGKKDGGRYRGLNLVPWITGKNSKRSDSTVEFRLHTNSLDANQVIGWAQLCAKMVEWAAMSTDSDIDALPKSSLRILSKVVAPELESWIVERVKIWHKQYLRNDRLVAFSQGEFIRR